MAKHERYAARDATREAMQAEKDRFANLSKEEKTTERKAKRAANAATKAALVAASSNYAMSPADAIDDDDSDDDELNLFKENEVVDIDHLKYSVSNLSVKRYYLLIFESICVIVTFHSIQLLLMPLICVRKKHFYKLKKLSLSQGYVSDNSNCPFLNFYVQKWSNIAPIRIRTACAANLAQVHLPDSDRHEIFAAGR